MFFVLVWCKNIIIIPELTKIVPKTYFAGKADCLSFSAQLYFAGFYVLIAAI